MYPDSGDNENWLADCLLTDRRGVKLARCFSDVLHLNLMCIG